MPLPRQSKRPAGEYDRTPLRRITHDCLRPGGVELTAEGLKLCAFPSGSTVLDLGCGAGASLGILRKSGYAAFGLDRSSVLLREAAEQSPVIRADFSKLPMRHSSLDGIVCECVLSLAPDKDSVLSECARVLKPGGRLLLSDITRKGEFNNGVSGLAPCMRGAEPVEGYAVLLRNNGFSLLHTGDHTRRLRELAAQISWEFGSLAEFFRLWRTDSNTETPSRPDTPCVSGKNLGYCLIVAEKTPVTADRREPERWQTPQSRDFQSGA